MNAPDTSTAALKSALIAVRELRGKLENAERARTEPIAVLGMGCRFPGADSPQAFWDLLRDGVDAITEVPADRWDSDSLYDRDPAAPGKVASRWGGFLDRLDRFDAAFFGISPREANQMDPQQRILLEVAWEALESAGQPADRLAGSQTGVFVGVHSHSNDYAWLQFADPGRIDTYTGTGTSHSVIAGRLSYLLDLRGPSVSLDTACSSSLVAVHLASQSLRSGESDLALAGGVNLALGPQFTMATTKMHMMAADGRCKTFDAGADGFVRGEGCGVVVLKRLSDAERDGDPILGVIRGSAVNQDGKTNGLTAPSGLSQQAIVRQALRNAAVDPAAVSAVEAHGTGTELGDPIEVEALREVFGAGGPIALTSVKTNIGHLEAAAGIAGLIKVLLSLRHETIPPHLHLRTVNPDIPLDGSRFVIPTEPLAWPLGDSPRYATVSSFGWSGTNGCLVVAEPPAAAPSESGERVELLPISARSPEALRALAESYRSMLPSVPSLHDFCYTASVRRSHNPFRLAVTGRSPAELAARLAVLDEDVQAAEVPAGPVFVFSGQGAQWAGMGRQLLGEPVAAEMLRRCDELFRAYADWSLLDEIDGTRLNRTEIAQPALFAVQVALAAQWRSWGIEPEVIIGHSVGEVAAAHVAGALSLEDAVCVAFHRGRVMQEAHGRGRMAAVGLPVDEAIDAITPYGDQLTVAAVNGPLSTVLAGYPDPLAEIVAGLGKRGVFGRMLRVEYAFHSAQMEPFGEPLMEALRGISPRPAAVPVISTVTGRRHDEFGPEYWGRNIRDRVRFADALAQLDTSTTHAVIEISPQPVLARPVDECLGQAGLVVASMRADTDARTTLLSALGRLYRANHPVDWQRLYPAGARCVPLPSYPWQRERHWVQAPKLVAPKDVRHPLLGRRVRSAVRTFENELTSTTIPFLGDHRIFEQVLLPMTAYLDLALTAGSGTSVTDLVLHEAMVLSDDTPRSVQTVVNGEAFQVFSQPASSPDDTPWTLHATGTVQDGQSSTDPIDLDELCSRFERVAVEPLYQRLRAAGIEHGPVFAGIRQLWRGPAEALALVESDASVALLDACAQVLFAALPDDHPVAYLPISLDRFDSVKQPETRVWSHARLREHNAETAVADVELRAADGGLVARLDGLLLKRTGRSSSDDELLYEIAWEPSTMDSAPTGTGDWLIVGGSGSALSEALRARGQGVVVVPQASEDVLNQKPWRGIVYLDGLQAAAEPAVAYEQSTRDLLGVVHAMAGEARLWLVTRGAQAVGTVVALAQVAVSGLAKAISRERPELHCVCVDLDPAGDDIQRLCDVLLSAGVEEQVAIRDGEVFVPRLTRAATSVQLRVGERGVLEHLAFHPVSRRAPRAGEVEIRVRATGLNFRDVLTALGMYPGDAGPLGLECAGEIVAAGPDVRTFAAGDRVVAMAPASFGTYTTVAAERVVRMPDALGFSEAATIPIAFLTAAYGLRHLARVKPGDRVLIHAAAGGVGLAAVRLAHLAGAEVFATAAPAKWAALRECGVRHVFNSRTLDFADEIGEGTIDVVLNSLTDDFIPRSITLLRPGGSFVEIGKRDIWDAADVARLRPDIGYHPFDLGAVADDDPALIQAMLRQLMDELADRRLEPLPLTEFPLTGTVDAFRFMAQARHVGKIVVAHEREPVVRPDATYLVTGGLGALGLTVTRWLVGQGARHLVLLGRRTPTPETVAELDGLPADIVTRQVDVSDPAALADVFADIATTMPALRGVVHAAGVLDDGVLEHQTWERFARVAAPKVAGGWNLHQLTRDLPLDFFVLFSSAASLLGAAGQSGYVTANTFLDGLAHHRRSIGLPATSVNWGSWAVGMAAANSERLAAQGFRPLTAEQATGVLGRLIRTSAVQAGVLAVDFPVYLRQFDRVPRLFARFEEAERRPAARQGGVRERIEAAHPAERPQLLSQYVQAQASKILGLPPAQAVSPHQPLRELGLDSLMAVELRNTLGLFAGRSLPSTMVFDHPTVTKLSDYLLRELFPGNGTPLSDEDGQSELVARVAGLDDADVEKLLAEKLVALDMGDANE
jgi:acyl transferase domain-containing protein/NADPH:quinone reductase-like Zn-dependent oxidoreductase